jgi:hypothetical protein
VVPRIAPNQTKEQAQANLLAAIYDKDIVTTPIFRRPYGAEIVMEYR